MSSEAARSCADALVVELGKEYSGVKLSPVMIETVVKYLVDVVKVKDIDEVDLGDACSNMRRKPGATLTKGASCRVCTASVSSCGARSARRSLACHPLYRSREKMRRMTRTTLCFSAQREHQAAT